LKSIERENKSNIRPSHVGGLFLKEVVNGDQNCKAPGRKKKRDVTPKGGEREYLRKDRKS